MAETLRWPAASVISRVVVWWYPWMAKRRSASSSSRARVSVASRGMQWQEGGRGDNLHVDVGHGLCEHGERGLGLLPVARGGVDRVEVVLGDHLVTEQLEHLQDLFVFQALTG